MTRFVGEEDNLGTGGVTVVLASETLRHRLPAIITGYREHRIHHAAYELSAGPEAFITGDRNKTRGLPGDVLTIPSGQSALLITEETLTMPLDLIGLISMKSGAKLGGLINISGFHVDPGFRGRLTFSVYNAGSRDARILIGRPLFLIWFLQLDAATNDGYAGQHQNQHEITAGEIMSIDGDVVSPAALKQDVRGLNERILRLEGARGAWTNILVAAAGGALVLLAQWVLPALAKHLHR